MSGVKSVQSALSPDEFILKLKRYIAQVRRDHRLSGENVETVTVHSRQLCGSWLTLDAIIEGNSVQALGYRVRACSLGQATTAIVHEHAPGMTAEEIQSVQIQLEQILKNDLPNEDALIWDELAIFQHAASMPSRHDSALLPFRALQEIFAKEKQREF